MDERHWWIAGKIQESFHFGGFDNPTLLEDFITESETLDMIDQFLSAGGPCRLFVYCTRPDTSSGKILSKDLHITGTLADLRNLNLEDVTVVYFLRHSTEKQVEVSHIENQIFCGDLKGNTIELMSSMLGEVYLPLIRSQKEWKQCQGDNKDQLVHNMEKVLTNISESGMGSHSSKHVMLRLPENLMGTDFKQQRLAALDQSIITEYEQLVTDWMTTIEAILSDTSDERFMDPNAGPLSELDRWRRRQRLLISITEQLKGKECKAVMGVLITAKSRLLKKWKVIDSGMTDAQNDTKDKVRYLESLKRHLDQLYHGATPASLINTALPGLLHSIKQMDSVSRYFARQGFLGLLLTKVTNQLVLACKDYIHQCTMGPDEEDMFWTLVQDEIQSRGEDGASDDAFQRNNTQLTTLSRGVSPSKRKMMSGDHGELLYNRLRACLGLQTYYRDALRSLRDALGASQNLSHFTSMSSLGNPGNTKSKLSARESKQRPSISSSPSKKAPSYSEDGHGVSVADEETILSHLDAFCGRIKQILDVINTMSQFSSMVKTAVGLPRPRKDDLVAEDNDQQAESPEEIKISLMNSDDHRDLDAINESEETLINAENERRKQVELSAPASTTVGLSRRDVELLKKYYPDHKRGEGPSVAEVVQQHIEKMSGVMLDYVTTNTILDVESKDRDRFEDVYTVYLQTGQDLERYLAAYLHAIFIRRMKTHEALDIMTKFSPIAQRPGVRITINEKFIEIFNWYEVDLDAVQQLYEQHKESPPALRNSPPVAGAISWSRQLMRRIEEPMKVFRDNRAITHLKDYSRIVKIYNRVATALVTFESLWFVHWKQSIEIAKSGLHATLFITNPETGEIVVNADEKVLQLIQEARALTRLDIQIPECAKQVLMQESRFKSYKDHLNLCLSEYKEVCDSIPAELKSLFQVHVDAVLANFQPGLSTLAWNSMNIDAFLHQLHSGIGNLKYLVDRVNSIMQHKVEDTIDKIKDMIFFDYKLAFSRSWPPNEFMKMVTASISGQSQQLYDYISVIETSIKECASILTQTKKTRQGNKESRNDKAHHGSSDPLNKVKEQDRIVAGLLENYSAALYGAVLLATTRSLVTLAESAGCVSESVRAASALSDAPSNASFEQQCSRTGASSSQSRAASATERSRPVSIMSMLSNMTWTSNRTHDITYLQFEVLVKFSIPNIEIVPQLDEIQKALKKVAKSIMQVPKGVRWLGSENLGEEFLDAIKDDEVVDDLLVQINGIVNELDSVVKNHLFHFSMYDFLWKDDMYGNYYEFIQHDPGNIAINTEVERLLKIEKKVLAIPQVLPVGPICLQTDPIKDALHGFAMAWKNQYASVLHEEAKKKLDGALQYRGQVRTRLELPVSNLDQLNSTLQLLEELRDMENKVDAIYLPIENMYAKLREFELRLARDEVEEVDLLRERWAELLQLAETVTHTLLKERRSAFEQELDKQVKGFVVEVIQFRNAFDAQGPAVPGISPSEAVQRLSNFQHRYSLYNNKRKTLDSVSKLFGIPCKPFPELDKTGEELELLGNLYGLFQKFLRFDDRFRDALWAEVDLESATREVESYWDECLALPSKLKDWDAYTDMKGSIQAYRDIFPLLHSLASREIRNRHWLQVMAVTGSSFQLEANVFRLSHLLDIGLMKHRGEIEEICRSASRELELEIKLRMTEEEWTEQVLNFEHYKKRGPMFLDKTFTERLLEQLEDAQALLAQMLTSRYIGPLREEAASWAEKLKEVGEVLEVWLEVQDLWHFLEAVFSNENNAKELPQEAKRFARLDKSWTKMMKRAYDTRNVLQCCYGEEVPKGVVLRHIYQELEICFKSLEVYLDNKRRVFPRFYFVTDPILLAILSRPNDLESVRPYLKSMFAGLFDVVLDQYEDELEDELPPTSAVETRRSSTGDRSRGNSAMGYSSTTPPPRIDKRLTQHQQQNIVAMGGAHLLPGEMMGDDAVTMEAVSVSSVEGETLNLLEKVPLVDGVDQWIRNLKNMVQKSLRDLTCKIMNDINNGSPPEDWAAKYPTQVCRLGLLYFWTRECEQGINDLKYDRKAMHTTSKRFFTAVSKIQNVLLKGSWKNAEDAMLPVHRVRMENLMMPCLFMRDLIDNMAQRKLRENTDFEWRRNLRLYGHIANGEIEPTVVVLDDPLDYGYEFYGAQQTVGLTPTTDRAFLAMAMSLKAMRGSMATGDTAAGKTETVKGFAQALGRFLFVYQCAAKSDAGSLSKVIQGLAMDGCWGCFDDIQNLNKEGVALLLDHVQSIFGALKSGSQYCYINDGQEVPVTGTVGFFLTYNPSLLPAGSAPLPNDVRVLFRSVTFTKPDLGLVLKAKCAALGFKLPAVLALRLRLVTELARDQLPEEAHHSLSTASLQGVLLKASQRRRFTLREEKSSDNLAARGRSEGNDKSRSNSEMSNAPAVVAPPSSSMGQNAGHKSYTKTKSNSPNPMGSVAKTEHAVVGQALLDIIGPRLSPENNAVFKQIVRDIFAGLPSDSVISRSGGLASAHHRGSLGVESAIETTAADSGLVPHKPWLEKCLQLYNVSQVHQGIIVAGPPGAGKSSVVQALVDALCVSPRGMSRGSTRNRAGSDLSENNHKLQRLYPLVADDLNLIFGHLNQNHDWVDGIFTSAWKKATRNQSTTWLVMDGPLTPSWVDNFTSVLDTSKTLTLANGDQLFLSNNVKLLFETDELSSAAPSIVARSGIVYLDNSVVGWRPIAKAYLENRTQQEVRVLQRAFNKTVDPITHFVLNECKPRLKLCEVGMFKTCINMMSAMLADNIELGGELHIERLYLFCVMWSYGGLLDEKDTKGFNDLLGTLSTALPDDDRDICFFDYYVDESGEWDPWHSRVPESTYPDQHNILGEVFVDTVHTIRVRLLIDFAYASGQNVLLVGPPGSGKTAMINDFMDNQDAQAQVTKKLVYSGSSNAAQLQSFIEANIFHRQGYVYGAKENKRLQLFIDDLNLPSPDEYGVQRCNELLRRMVDDRVLCTLQKPFEWRTLEGLTVLSTMTMSEHPSVPDRLLHPRLLRHFAVLHLPEPGGDTLRSVLGGVLEASMLLGERPALDLDLHTSLVAASCSVLTSVKDVLRPTPMPGRMHYFFTLRDFVTCFQCMKRLADESRADEKLVVSLWRHEMERVIRDRLCRFADLKWYDETVEKAMKEYWPDLVEAGLFQHFVTFPTDTRVYQRPVTSLSGKKEVRVQLQPVDNLKDVHNCLQAHLKRYNEEFGNVFLDINLSENIIGHIVKLHRVLAYHHGGNFLLVGPIGSHLGTLCKLALHVADLDTFTIDTSKRNTFFDGLRSAVRLTGSEGKTLTVFFDGRDLHDDLYLDAVNSLLISGEYPHLFTNDEMDGLLLALGPAMKREVSATGAHNVDPARFFVSRVKTNLHIIICLHPRHQLLDKLRSHYPGLLSGAQMMWVTDWTKEALLGEASYYLTMHNISTDADSISESIMTCMANIHSFVLHDCRQTKWAGEIGEEIPMTQVTVNEKKKDQLKMKTVMVPNRPWSKTLLLENIKLRHRSLHLPTTSELYVGPTTYKRFMDTFRHIYTQKAEHRTNSVNQLKRVLATLDQTRKDSRKMKEHISTMAREFESVQEKTARLMAQLTGRATTLEKLKARVGIATSLSAFLQLNEMSEEEEEDDSLLKDEERDEYDDIFDQLREANLKTRSAAAKEEHGAAIARVDDCRRKLSHAKAQVEVWKHKVDRTCIERLKNFQSPPLLVGQIMEMVMTLIGKRAITKPGVTIDYPRGDNQSGRFSASSGSTKAPTRRDGYDDRGNKKDPERFDRHAWKGMQQTMQDSVKFVDMLHNVPWEDGLPNDVVTAVESYLARSKDGQLGVTGEGTLLDNAHEKEKSFVPHRRSPSPENSKGISIAAAKYSSEDAATLVNYTIAIVEYTRLCAPLKAALERVTELEREIAENERLQREKERENLPEEEREKTPGDDESAEEEDEDSLTSDDLPRLQSEVDGLQAQFDAAVVEKHSLEMELVSMRERLKAATDMVDSLKQQEGSWRAHVKEYCNNDVLVANCIAAAAFLVYCGGMNTDVRRRMGEFFMTICEHHGIPLPSLKLFRNLELCDFLYEPLVQKELEQLGLPQTRLMLENATFIMQGDNTVAWPLLCDPTSRVIDWVKFYHKAGKGLVTIRYSEVRSHFDTCLAEGLPLLITDVDVEAFVRDPRFLKVLISRHMFVAGKNPFKIPVGDHDVECQPHFRLFLHTTTLPHQIPAELGAHVAVVYFHAARPDVEEQLLNRFMALEKSRVDDERNALLQERLEYLRYQKKLEEQMIECLSSDVRLLMDLPATKRMAEFIKHYDETQDSLSKIDLHDETILRGREGYRVIARRGAVCFDTMQYLREVSPTYQTCWQTFMELYDAAIAHSDRAAVKSVVDRLTYSCFLTTVRGLMERDRPLYQLLLALEIEDGDGRVGPGEREYLISPSLGSVTMTSLGHNSSQEKFTAAKKPFDWMADDQFNNLQILAIHYEWFQEMFERMPRDGRETQWRTLCESDAPEQQILPDKMDDWYSPLQRMLVIRAVRPDRLMQLATLFIHQVMGKKYCGEIPLDMSLVLKQSSPQTPVLLLYTTERETAERIFYECATKKQIKMRVVPLSGSGPNVERNVKKRLAKAMKEGQWVLLQNGHLVPGLLLLLESLLAEAAAGPGEAAVDAAFRCWVTAEATPDLPTRLLQRAVTVMSDTPRTMKDTILRGFSWIDSDFLRQSARPEWAPLLHNLCYLHGAIRLRARFGRGGWNQPEAIMQIGNNELMESLLFAAGEMKDTLVALVADGSLSARNTSWTALRFMLAELIYGNYITDPLDQASLAAMVDYWISPNTVKRDFELPRVKYRLPAAFFNPAGPRLSQMVQAVDNLSHHMLEVPEAANLHPSLETVLGDDQYVYTRLNRVYDAMPATHTLSHQLFPRPPTPFDGPPVSNISPTGNSAAVVHQGVFASGAFAALRMKKEVELWEICHSTLPKVPKAYSKEYVTERIKKIGGFTSFNMYIMRELELMYALVNEVRATLTAIKGACETTLLGDQLTPEHLSAADDLYHLRIPESWCRLSRDTAPPPNQALNTWLTDLQNRCQHLEKILVLGREKMPAYWLGAFFYPRGLLALLKQDAYRNHNNDRSGNIENFVFHTEITARDKDHIRDPPAEGMFVFGIYLWGCQWEKTNGDLMDAPNKGQCATLPVIHVTCWPQSEKPGAQDTAKQTDTYACPVYHSRLATSGEPLMEVELMHQGIPASRWALRGLSATVRPF